MEIWSNDLFDREADPSLESGHAELDGALRALWKLVLEQGVQDDGQPTFTDFQLRLEGRPSVFIPRDPARNPELALLRSLRHEADFYGALASVHASQLGRAFDFGPFLDLGPPSETVKIADVLRGALSITEPLKRDGLAWRAGPLSVGAGWAVRLDGLEFKGKPVRFVVTAGKVESDDSPATQPLRDALLAAGLC
ncbi:MAG: hypothetical protein Q8L48_40700 [Archangium sp.]|nr:hypothetical protein [Archangium sp.]